SSSVDQSSDSKDGSSSSVDQSSDSKDDSSSSEGSTFVKSFEAPSVGSEEVMMRRLDGTLVKNAKNAVPGVYYVKTANGLWKKKVVLPK
ncbi:MAG: hypothetical protein MJY82_04525, partial [Fibrobacter sp.]|nr:hypothetical protein [Fibrobacter sp.]